MTDHEGNELESELLSTLDLGNDQLIRELTELAADPRTVLDADGEERRQYVIVPPGAHLHSWDLDDWAPTPVRKTGNVVVHDRPSFLEYLARQNARRSCTVYHDVEIEAAVAVLDDHEGDVPGWQQHRITLAWKVTPEWRAWKQADGNFMKGADIAEFIEEWRHTIAEPDAAELIDLVRSFKAIRTSTFRSDTVEQTGDSVLEFVTETTGGATATQLTVPETLELRVAPYEGADEQEVTARFRYRADGETGRVTFGFRLVAPDKAERDAMDDDVLAIETDTERPVLNGRLKDRRSFS